MSCGNPHDTPCSEVLDKMYEFLDAELGPVDIHRVDEHLHECGPCMTEHDIDRVVKVVVARACGGTLAPDEVRAAVIFRIRTLADSSRAE